MIKLRDRDGVTGAGLLAIFTTLVVLVTAGMLALGVALDRAACQQNAAILGVAYTYEIPAGCFIQDGRQWEPYGTWVNVHEWKGTK